MTTSLIAAASDPILNPSRGRRRFHLLDAVILVAATAVASGIAVWIDRASGLEFSWSDVPRLFAELSAQAPPGADNHFGTFILVVEVVFGLGLLVLPFVAMWTVAIVPIRLLGPRPRFRRLARQPGMMAAIVASLGIAIAVVQVACTVLCSAFGGQVDILGVLLLSGGIASYPGLAVFFAWLTLLAGGRWRTEPDWVDRAGRAFGAYWIVMGVSIPGMVLLLAERA